MLCAWVFILINPEHTFWEREEMTSNIIYEWFNQFEHRSQQYGLLPSMLYMYDKKVYRIKIYQLTSGRQESLSRATISNI